MKNFAPKNYQQQVLDSVVAYFKASHEWLVPSKPIREQTLHALRDRLHHYHTALREETLLAHRSHWGEEPEPARHDLSRLTTGEAAVYDDLRFDRLQPRLRLEQERVGYGWVCDRLACIPSGVPVSPPHCA